MRFSLAGSPLIPPKGSRRTAHSFPGCVQEVRPIGLLEMLDQGVLDEKVLAVGKNNPRYTNVWNYTDIYPHMLKEITHFFSIYKDL